MIFETTITEFDIPVTVEVTSYDAGSPARLNGHPDTWAEKEPEEIEFDLFDYQGRRNAALFDLIEVADVYRIEDEAATLIAQLNEGY